MTTRHQLDPQLASVIDQIPVIPLTLETINEKRAAYARLMAALLPQLPDIPGVDVHESRVRSLPGAPEVTLYVYRQAGSNTVLPVLLWLHGGGFIDGRAEWDHHIAKSLARDVECCVISIDYRLAPEAPFPAAIEDCYAALEWTHANATELRIDPDRIGVAGISAGGGLAATLALLARDRGGVDLCFQALLQPMLDDRTGTSVDRNHLAGEFIWTRTQNNVGWSALLGTVPGGDDVSPYAAAARAPTLAGLPPTFIAVGALDLFVDEDIEYATRLIREGVATELHVLPGACHAFQYLAPDCAAAKSHDAAFKAALRRGLGAASAKTDGGIEATIS